MISQREIKHLRNLHQKKYRTLHSQFLIEGKRLVNEAISSQATIVQIWIKPNFAKNKEGRELLNRAKERQIPYDMLSDKELKYLSTTVHNQGVMALVYFPKRKPVHYGEKQNWIFLDNVSDPGNLGTILRTADWFGIQHVGLSPHCADPYNPKVIRGGMGAHFHLSIYIGIHLKDIKSMGHSVIAADQRGKPISNHYPSRLTNWCLVLGSEAHGISEEIKPLVDHFIAIPGSGKSDSLNVAIAGGILMYLFQIENKNTKKRLKGTLFQSL